MTAFFSADKCIISIIEMKGREGKKQKRGIVQICTFRDMLKKQIQTCLPKQLKVFYQGILLSPPNSDTPRHAILKEYKQNQFVISPVQSNQKAELFRYVTRILGQGDTFNPAERMPHPQPELNLLEEILTRGQTKDYLKNHQRSYKHNDSEGSFYLSYRYPKNMNPVVGLGANKKGYSFAVSIQDQEWIRRIQMEIKKVGLKISFTPLLCEQVALHACTRTEKK